MPKSMPGNQGFPASQDLRYQSSARRATFVSSLERGTEKSRERFVVSSRQIVHLVAGVSHTQMQKENYTRRAMDAAQGSIVVNAPADAVYKRWLAFEEYPKFITAIKRVRKLDTHHFIATLAFGGKRYDAMLEIMLRVPERRLAWRTVANGHASDHLATGVVSFESPSERTTRITLKLSSSFGGVISRRVDRYLQNFKELVEAS
jgi:uncharacterized membrane protein